jgi:hypothetical protein
MYDRLPACRLLSLFPGVRQASCLSYLNDSVDGRTSPFDEIMLLPDARRNYLGYLWLGLLAVALSLSALRASQRAAQAEEYAVGCDAFGYLQMAQEVRRAWAARRRPDFTLETPRTRQLIDFLKSRNVPETEWQFVVGPHAFLYFPRAGHIGPVYPPGMAYALSLFPPSNSHFGKSLWQNWL